MNVGCDENNITCFTEDTIKENQSKKPIPCQVLIVDDHPIVVKAFRELINGEEDMHTCGCAKNIEEALALLEITDPDVITVDLSMEDNSGVAIIDKIKQNSRDIKILVVSRHDELSWAERCLAAGAQGYVMKTEDPDKVIEAIRCVKQDNVYVSDCVNNHIKRKHAGSLPQDEEASASNLTPREMEVLQLFGGGKKTAEIAGQLGISKKTVEAHIEHLKCKFGVSNTKELMIQAVVWSNKT